jgi:hypothetical protein
LCSLIVDVKLSAVKTGKICIWRGDDPLELASSFARIYSLDTKARDLLVTVIHQSMEANGLLVLPQVEGNMAGEEGEDEEEESLFEYAEERDLQQLQSGRVHSDPSGHGLGSSAGFGTAVTGEDDYLSESTVSGSLEEDQSEISAEESLGSGSESERESGNLTA